MTEVQDDIFIIVCGIWPHNSQGLPQEIKGTKMLISVLQIDHTPINCPRAVLLPQPWDGGPRTALLNANA